MIDYIKDVVDNAPSDMGGAAKTPAANRLFEINANCEKLAEAEAIMFHHISAKLLFLCKRAGPDIQTAIVFLSTRVKSPDKDDYKKLDE
jgi:hypothetical protein